VKLFFWGKKNQLCNMSFEVTLHLLLLAGEISFALLITNKSAKRICIMKHNNLIPNR
jgi:hypothetical protein